MEKFWFLNRIISFWEDRQGMVLVFSIMVLIMISVWGAATLTLSTNEYKITRSSKKAMQAYYLAEAGLEEAIAKIKANPESFNEFSSNLETGSYSVGKSGTIPGIITLTSVGTVTGGVNKTLTAQLEVIRTGSGSIEAPVIGSFGTSYLNVKGGATIYGDLVYNGDFKVNGSNRISGNIYCNGYLEMAGGSVVGGNIYSKDGVLLTSTEVVGAVYTDGFVNHNWDSSINGKQLYNPPNPMYSATNNGGYSIFPFINFEVFSFPEQYKGEWYLPSWGIGHVLTPTDGFIDILPELSEGESYYILPGGTILTGTIHKPGAIIVSSGKIEINNRYQQNPTQPDFKGLTIVADTIELNAYNALENCIINGKTSLKYGGISAESRTMEKNKNLLLISSGDITIPGGFGFQGGILSEGSVSVEGGTSIKGSIHGQEVSFSGIELIYDRDTLQTISWPFLGQDYKIILKKWN